MDSPSLLAIHKEPIYPSVYHVFWGGGKTYFSQSSFSMYSLSIWVIFFSFLALFYQCISHFIYVICYFRLFLNFSSMINLILVTFLPVLIGSNSMFISVNSLISNCAFSKIFLRKSGKRL